MNYGDSKNYGQSTAYGGSQPASILDRIMAAEWLGRDR